MRSPLRSGSLVFLSLSPVCCSAVIRVPSSKTFLVFMWSHQPDTAHKMTIKARNVRAYMEGS